MGCDVVIGDFHDLASLRAAVRDVDACYYSYPIREGITIASANVALAAKENGVRSIVKNTMAVTMDLSPSPFARQSFLAEQIFSWAGLTTVNLRSGFFFENLLRYSENEIIREGKIRWPLGSGETRMAWIAAQDVAMAACRMLRDQPKASETILLTGPDAFTFNEVADVCSTVLVKRVVYENGEEQDFFSRVNEIEGNNPMIVAHLKGLAGAFRAGKSFGKTTDDLLRLTEKRGVSLLEFLKTRLDMSQT